MNDSARARLKTLAQEAGGSFFFYDLDKLRAHLDSIQQHRFPGLRIWYACKANPLSAILKQIKDAGFGIDVASTGELNQARHVGFDGANTLATGPAKSKHYLANLISSNVKTIVCESLSQVRWLNEVAHETDQRPDVLLRVQLDWEQGTSVLGGNDITPFGIDIDQWQQLESTDYDALNVRGFHVFQWGNLLDLKQLGTIWSRIMTELQNLADTLLMKTEVIDLGGGLGIPYSDGDQALPFADVAELLNSLHKQFHFDEIWLELGRYMVGECGTYVTQVVDRKIVRGADLLVTAGGMNHIARPSLTGQPFPCINLDREALATQQFQIHGPLCTALDKLGTLDLADDTSPGDWLAFYQAGAYGMTESMPYFLCHDLPAEIISLDGNVSIIQAAAPASSWSR